MILAEQSKGGIFPDDIELREGSAAPHLDAALACVNVKGTRSVSLSEFAAQGKYVVLFFYPEDNFGAAAANNLKEVLNFQRLAGEFSDLDAVLVGCSAQSAARQQKFVNEKLLTMPFLSDEGRLLIEPFGFKQPIGETARQTFIIDTSGLIRFVERQIDFGVGNFNLDNHATRVQRELYKIRNSDGWSV